MLQFNIDLHTLKFERRAIALRMHLQSQHMKTHSTITLGLHMTNLKARLVHRYVLLWQLQFLVVFLGRFTYAAMLFDKAYVRCHASLSQTKS